MINLEKEIFNKTGSAKEKLIKFYGKDVSEKTASSYLSGIKLHLDTMRRLKKNLETFDEDNVDREISFNQDKSQTIKQDVYLTQDEKASPVKIMQKMGFDPILWEVVSCKIVSGSWDVAMKMVNTEVDGKKVNRKSKPLINKNRKYSITLTVKPLGGNITFPQILSAFRELEPVDIVEYEYSKDTNQNGSYLFELRQFYFI